MILALLVMLSILGILAMLARLYRVCRFFHHAVPVYDIHRGHRFHMVAFFDRPTRCNVTDADIEEGARCDSCGICVSDHAMKEASARYGMMCEHFHPHISIPDHCITISCISCITCNEGMQLSTRGASTPRPGEDL